MNYILLQLLKGNKFMSRYQTLDISLQTNMKNQSRLSQTLDLHDEDDDGYQPHGETDERVKKFRELYYRNEKLRKQLKVLNHRLNNKLQKVKLPNVKKRAVSVDLNYNPPNKAMIRELQNAYKQVAMYKKQIEILKVKEESTENYARLRDMENLVAYRDKQIAEIQHKLVSARNIKKLQEKKITSQLENQDIKERLDSYQSEHKQLRDKLKAIARKSRKREQEYKKQQAYLVSLERKVRNYYEQNRKQEENNPVEVFEKPNRHISQNQFLEVKQEIAAQKKQNDEILKKIQISKKNVQQWKKDQSEKQAKLKQKDALLKTLQTKIMALNRLIRDQERKEKQKEEHQQPPPNKVITNIEEEINDSFDDGNGSSEEDEDEDDGQMKKFLDQLEGVSGGEGYSKNESNREWKGKYRKIEHGFGGPSDNKFQEEGQLIGFNVALDENEAICGIGFIFKDNEKEKESKFLGNHSNVELKWLCENLDEINKISGSFTDQGYLNQLIVTSKKGKTGVFGAASSDPFMFILNPGEKISGSFGSIRNLGLDQKITEFGFWVSTSQSD